MATSMVEGGGWLCLAWISTVLSQHVIEGLTIDCPHAVSGLLYYL